jgi:hypothetical protein
MQGVIFDRVGLAVYYILFRSFFDAEEINRVYGIERILQC